MLADLGAQFRRFYRGIPRKAEVYRFFDTYTGLPRNLTSIRTKKSRKTSVCILSASTPHIHRTISMGEDSIAPKSRWSNHTLTPPRCKYGSPPELRGTPNIHPSQANDSGSRVNLLLVSWAAVYWTNRQVLLDMSYDRTSPSSYSTRHMQVSGS